MPPGAKQCRYYQDRCSRVDRVFPLARGEFLSLLETASARALDDDEIVALVGSTRDPGNQKALLQFAGEYRRSHDREVLLLPPLYFSSICENRCRYCSFSRNGERLTLELTESLLLDGKDENIDKLRRLKALGLHLSLDDFGTGYSSLAYLKNFPFDEIKIDRDFVRDIDTDPGGASLCKAIIVMADSLNLTVVGEGVENEAQLKFLHLHGFGVW